MNDFPAIEEMRVRIERVLRGEDISTPIVEAGSVPTYYGTEHPYDVWRRMRERMWRDDPTYQDDAFYEAGTIGWASR